MAIWKVYTQQAQFMLVAACFRFEELAYADAASYMEDGRIQFTGTPTQLKEHLRGLGAIV